MDIKTNDVFLQGTITPPASKSYLHRALIAASLAESKTIIEGFTPSNDVEDTIQLLKTLGITVEVMGNQIVVHPKKMRNNPLSMRESGTTYRLMIPILSVLFESFSLSVSESLYIRPLSEYVRLGLKRDEKNHTFVLKSGEFTIDGSVSSQFVSGLLMALPLLDGDSVIHFSNPTSINYVLMTLEVLNEFGIEIKQEADAFIIKGNQTYKGCSYTVEPDFSSIAFWAVAGVIKGDIFVKAPKESLQPDFEIIRILKEIGSIKYKDGYIFKTQELKPFDVSIKHCPDLAPSLAVLASFIDGESIIRDAERLQYKESNRLEEILKLNDIGGRIRYDSVLTIKKANFKPGTIMQNDHRIAMMYAIIAKEMTIQNIESIKKSYPGFLSDYVSLGGLYEQS